MTKIKRKYLYALLLEDNHYYIGQTDDLVRRFRQHSEQIGEGAIWTYFYKPIKMVEFWDLGEYTQEGAMQFENKLTINYMNKFGIENVRGGDYVFSDPNHHFNLVNARNIINDGIITPKIDDEGKKGFAEIKKILDTIIEDGRSYIYVLELKDSCVYISNTKNISSMLKKQFYGNGSLWLEKHRPVRLIELIEDKDLGKFHPIPFQNSIVKKYMLIYGWENVRGGDFKLIDEIEHQKLILKKMPDVINI